MKHIHKLASLAVLASCASLTQAVDVAQSRNHIVGRASHQAHENSIYTPFNLPKDANKNWSVLLNASGFYFSALEQKENEGLGAAPLWSGSNTMQVTLSNNQATTPNKATFLSGDQLGLGFSSNNVSGYMSLDPIFYQTGTDFSLATEVDIDGHEFFAHVHVPVGIAVSNPQLKSNVKRGDIGYQNIFSNGLYDSTNPPSFDFGPATLQEAFKGAGRIGSDYVGLQYGKIDGKQDSGVQFGDISFALGFNALHNENTCFGLAARASVPGGNKPTAEYMLEPIFGNGGYVTAGLQLIGHHILWNDKDAQLRLKFDATANHMFKNKKGKRSFDTLTNKEGSRYLLVADYTNASSANYSGLNGTTATLKGLIQNLINASTLTVSSAFALQAQALVALSYQSEQYTIECGYEFFARTKEQLELIDKLDNQRWAIMGQQRIYNATVTVAPGSGPVNGCQPNAVMGKLAASNDTISSGNHNADATQAANRIAQTDLNIDGQKAPAVYSSSIFANASYQWNLKHCTPHLGIHSSFEFSHSKNHAIPCFGLAINAGLAF